MKRLNAAVVGLGVGEQHIEGYRQHPCCDVTALCDTDGAVCERLRKDYPDLRVESEPERILTDPDIDVVSIASYDDAHFSQVKRALEHNKHVFVEKPLCLHFTEAVELRAALNQRPHLQLSSNLILRRCPRFIRLREMIRSQELGEVYYLEGDYDYGRVQKLTCGWRGEIDYYSVILGGAVHLVDLMLWLIGEKPVEVMGYSNKIITKNTAYRHYDFAAALLKYESGLIVKITANFGCVRPHFHRLSVYGSRATFVNQPGSALLYRSKDSKDAPEEMNEDYPGYQKGDMLCRFVSSILGEGEAEVMADEVFDTMSICLAMEQAVLENRQVKIQYI